MSFTTRCPHCGWTPNFPDDSEGKEVSCPECDHRFMANPVSLQDRALPGWMRSVLSVLFFWR